MSQHRSSPGINRSAPSRDGEDVVARSSDDAPREALDQLQEALRTLQERAREPKFAARLALAEERVDERKSLSPTSESVIDQSEEPASDPDRDSALDETRMDLGAAPEPAAEEAEMETAPPQPAPQPDPVEVECILSQDEIAALLDQASDAPVIDGPRLDAEPAAEEIDEQLASAPVSESQAVEAREGDARGGNIREARVPAVQSLVAYGDGDEVPDDDGALRDLDRDLAGGVEELIDGSYESVSALLEAVFDERGRIDLTDDDDDHAEPGDFDPGSPWSDEGLSLTDAEAENLLHVGEDDPIAVNHTARLQTAVASDGDEAGTPIESAPIESDVVKPDALDDLPEGTLESMEDLAAGAVDPPPKDVSARPAARSDKERATSPTEAVSVAARAAESASTDRQFNRIRERVHGAVTGAAGLLCRVLSPLGLPVRVLPPSLRPYVDLFALTILFWVPLIWLAVLLFRPS